MSNIDEDYARERQLALEAAAQDADEDTEEALSTLLGMQVLRRKDPDLERRYEQARDRLAKQLHREGPRWFVDSTGEKWLAFEKAGQKTTLDVEQAIAMNKAGQISNETLDEIAPRKQSLEGMHSAIRSQRLTNAQVQQLCSYEPIAAYVAFEKPTQGNDDE